MREEPRNLDERLTEAAFRLAERAGQGIARLRSTLETAAEFVEVLREELNSRRTKGDER